MKKINKLIIFTLLLLSTSPVYASTKDTVTFSKCVDGDTIKVMLNDKERTVRFLAVDTPETVHPTIEEEPYGKEASNLTCEKITNAKEIILEYDPNSDKEDKYDRLLAWVWVDGKLLQKELIEKGYAQVAYLYDDYKYTEELQQLEETASKNKVGLWSEEEPTITANDEKDNTSLEEIIGEENTSYLVIILLVIVGLIIIFIPKYRKKAISKVKRKAKKEINDYINKVLK